MTSMSVRRARLVGKVADVLIQPRLSGRDRFVVTIAMMLAVVGVGLADYVTPTVSLGVFYLLPVSAGTVVLGSCSGMLLALESTLTYGGAEMAAGTVPALSTMMLNSALRLLAYAFVVALLSALRELAVHARRSEHRNRDLLSVASHQLRTPVAGILASAEALTSEQDPTLHARLAHNLALEAERLARLVSALLQATRLDDGAVPELRPTDVTALCRAELELAQARSPELAIALSAAGGIVPATANPSATRDILANVLDNARRHARTRIDVTVRTEADRVLISVNDDGPGLPPGDEARAFERFITFGDHGGAGLGLPIARGLARVQGGELAWVGGAFVLALRAAPAPPERGQSRGGVRRPPVAATPPALPVRTGARD